jgi:hypothetical protein
MQASSGQPVLRPGPLKSYTAWSIGTWIAWAAVWAATIALHQEEKIDVLGCFLGWVIGWTSATIARVVYPPPEQRPSAGRRSFLQGLRKT